MRNCKGARLWAGPGSLLRGWRFGAVDVARPFGSVRDEFDQVVLSPLWQP